MIKTRGDVMSYVFGPVPSRRLGRSIGVNNIIPRHCSYSCVYCQLGRAVVTLSTPRFFYEPDDILAQVKERILACEQTGDKIDYLTIVPDGEPTLDTHLDELISGLKETGYPVAVITNSSLLGDSGVRDRLVQADWVSVKVDAVSRELWRRVNRPHKSIEFDRMLEGMRRFASDFSGTLTTESMLIHELNTSEQELESTASCIGELHPDISYISIPTRPPAESWVRPADEHELTAAYALFSRKIPHVEHLTGYEGNMFSTTGSAAEDILSITAVHPMRSDALADLLDKDHSDWELVRRLAADGLILETAYGGSRFYVRKFRDRQTG
jgi:wyosine [tRNA(Phe)-imidazoG37] synthetase (radical SAM superfamily)